MYSQRIYEVQAAYIHGAVALSNLFRIILLTTVAGLILFSPLPGFLLGFPGLTAAPASTPLVPSWNSAVPCGAQVLTAEQLIGPVGNPKQSPPGRGADYSGGALQLAGRAAAGSRVSSNSWPYGKRWPIQPCSAKNADGTTVPTLVEIHGLTVTGVDRHRPDCNPTYGNNCDLSFRLCNAVLAPNCSETSPDSMHTIYVEIDMAWIYYHISPALPSEGSTIDVQGFAFWDDAHTKEPWHVYSGWELHPLTAWRPTGGSIPLSASFSYTPSTTVSVGDSISFSATAAGGTPPYSYGWNFAGNTTTNTVSANHSFTSPGYQNVTLSVADSKGFRTTTSQLLTILGPPDFQLSTDPSNLLLVSGSSSRAGVTVSSLSGFYGRLAISARTQAENITIQLSATEVRLRPGRSESFTLTAIATRDIEPGSYPVTVEATSSVAVRDTILTVNIPGFDVSVDTSSLEIPPNATGSFPIILRSLGGFSDSIVLTTSTSLPGLELTLDPSTVQLLPDSSANTTLKVTSSNPTTYNVLVTATNGIIQQTLPLVININNGADFAITPASPVVTQEPGTTQATTLTIASLNGFYGNVSLKVETNPAGTVVSAPSTVALTQGTTVPVEITISTSPGAAREYSIIITGKSGVISHNSRIVLNVSSSSGSPVFWEAAIIVGGVGGTVALMTVMSRRPKILFGR